MSKDKVAKMMADRSPLRRQSVKPVNLYAPVAESQGASAAPVSAKAGAGHGKETKLERYTTYLPPELIEAVEAHAKESGMKRFKVIQVAVEQFLKQ